MKNMKISVPDWRHHPTIGPATEYYITLKRLGVDAAEWGGLGSLAITSARPPCTSQGQRPFEFTAS